MSYINAICIALGAYLIGSLPTGYILALYGGIKDIRNHGSGNTGATNVARVLGLHYFIPVFVIDVAKSAVYLVVLRFYGWNESFLYVNALLLLAGNSHSIFLHFTGGKGIATATGILTLLVPNCALFLFCLWLMLFTITRTVGIASAISCLALVFVSLLWWSSNQSLCLTLLCIGLWGVWRHTQNIKRYFQLPID